MQGEPVCTIHTISRFHRDLRESTMIPLCGNLVDTGHLYDVNFDKE